MFSEVIILMLIIFGAFTQSYTPSTDDYVLNDLIPFLNVTNFLLDGPASVSYAPTTPTTNAKPSLQQMMYYNYYCASMYCQYQIADLSCTYCQKFKNDIAKQKILKNDDMDVTAIVTLSNSRREIVVTFRGSQNPWNFVLDFTMLSVCYDIPNCHIRLHVGFYTQTMALYNDVICNIGYLLSLKPNYKIVLTGHSLGGAMARITTFFILYMKQFPGKVIELYTYGEPRVGNKGFADYMNGQTITTARVTARADFAPHIMPVSILGIPLMGDYYIHPQTEYWINGTNGQKWADQSTYNDPTCSDSMGPAYSVLDHFYYFDADYLVCWLNAPQVWLALPASLLQPVGTIPPLPKFITNFLSANLGWLGSLLGGLLGR